MLNNGEKPVIIDVVGAHSTGKDTLMNNIRDYLSEDFGTHVITIPSVSRTHLKTMDLKIYDKVDDFSQCYISLLNWSSILSSAIRTHSGDNPVVLCNDLVVRSLAYTLVSEKCSPDVVKAHKLMLDAIHNLYSAAVDIYRIYLPIEFDVVPDGVRSLDKEYRAKVDNSIKYVLSSCRLPYFTITGNMNERQRKAKDFVQKYVRTRSAGETIL